MNEWKTYKLGEIAELKYGKDHKKLDDGKIPVFGSGGIMRYAADFLYNNESILIPRKGTLSNLFYVNEPFWSVDTMFYTKISENVNAKFLYYYLKNQDLASLNVGSAVPSLTTKVLNQIKIRIPPLPTQRRIAQILTSLDDKIELNLQMNQTLEAMAQAVFKEWFLPVRDRTQTGVEFNFPSLSEFGCVGFKDDRMKDDENTEKNKILKSTHPKNHNSDHLPKGWKMGKLGEICKVQNGYAFKSKDFLNEGENGIIKIKSISNNVVNIENMQYVSNDVADCIVDRFKIKSGDLLIAMTGAEAGKIGIVPNTEKKLWLNQRVGSFKEKVKYAKWFCYLILSTAEYQNILLNSARGSAQPNISGSQIEATEIIMPSKGLIKEFGNIINPLFDKILENYSINQTLTQTRDALLPKLMSGKINV